MSTDCLLDKLTEHVLSQLVIKQKTENTADTVMNNTKKVNETKKKNRKKEEKKK